MKMGILVKVLHYLKMPQNTNMNYKILFLNYFKYESIVRRYRYCSTLSNISRENFLTFDSLVEKRREEAKKSILVEVRKGEDLKNIHSVCSHFGNIKNMFEFTPPTKETMCIIEFEEEASLKEIVQMAHRSTNGEEGSIQFPCLKVDENKIGSKILHSGIGSHSILFETSNKSSTEEIVNYMTHSCHNVSEQIQYFYDKRKMTETSWRLRFLTCRRIEWILPPVLSHCKVLPFGSSVNTFGNCDCDLDMMVDFSSANEGQEWKDFPFIIQPGKEENYSRGYIKGNLQVIAELMSFYMPGFVNMNKVFRARVPIIKCNDTFTGLECDITFQNRSAYYMSELLYLYGCSDTRVRPLVFCVRWWAKQKHLTRKNMPGRWFSNFMTTLMVLFFLMNTKLAPVIPPVKVLQDLSDKSFTCHGIPYSYVKDVASIPATANSQTLEELLADFFSFYSIFDFNKCGISIITGKSFPKPNSFPLYIENPCERNLNVTRNLSLGEVKAFQEECNSAATLFKEIGKKINPFDTHWGLPFLVGERIKQSEKKKSWRSSYIASVFDGKNVEEQTSTNFVLKQNPKTMKLQERALRDVRRKLVSTPSKQKSKMKTSRNARFFPNFKF